MPNTGALATAAWCASQGLAPTDKDWFVEIVLHAHAGRFAIEIYPGEWGFALHHDNRESWIRVTDIPFVHGKDELDLLTEVAGLPNMGRTLRVIERRFGLAFARETATVRTNVAGGEPAIREWIASL